MTPPRVVTPGMGVGGRLRGASGTPPPTGCPGTGGGGRSPLIRPCGATFPRGGRQGLQGRDSSLPGCLRQREPPRGVEDAAPYGLPGNGRRRKVAAGWGHPALRMGIWKRPRGLRGQPFPRRRTVGAGHARPGGLRRHPSMVRPVGRGLDPSASGCPGDGRWREAARGVGVAAPYGLPGNERQREAAAGWGASRRTTSGAYKQFLCKHRRGGIYAARGVDVDTRFRAATR